MQPWQVLTDAALTNLLNLHLLLFWGTAGGARYVRWPAASLTCAAFCWVSALLVGALLVALMSAP